ncbi:MAG: adenylate/guanylate cyclase domain-containing protein [Actinomycetota bacterium]
MTFLFTDIEGSTQLVHELGDRFGDLLNHHHRILREVFSEHDGVEVSTEGDAFFVAFSSVPDAVNAAAEVQRRLTVRHAGNGAELRVRIGLHTGEAQLVGDNYGGLDVHRAARIASAGHGGQVLLSAVTASHAQGSSRLAQDVRVQDLGRFRLKDLDGAEQLFQLCIEGLRADFPPPRAMGNPIHLPPRLDEFVDRDREAGEIRALLDANRLVTLTGPGGTGKTRLGTEVARRSAGEFPDGIFFVALAAIVDSELVPSTIAEALSLREKGTQPIIDIVKDYLEHKRTLLLLDNFEQVVAAAPLVSELLGAAPELKVIVTSRASLRVSGEQEYLVPPMNMPDPQRLPELESLQGYESIMLFLQRARALKPDFALTEENAAAVSEICVRLDGLPLAIELAAARVRLLSPQEILTRLDRSLSILSVATRDVPQRQRTLTDAIDWSYRLLDEGHQALFRRLGVFSSGWTLESAEAVCDPEGELGIDVIEGLEFLVSNSLVHASHRDVSHTRLGMLQTIREYALRVLTDSGELEGLQRRHGSFFTELARKAEPEIFNEDQDWPDRLDFEHDNLRAVLRRAIDVRAAKEGLVLAACLWRFWQIRSHLAEGRMWLAELLSLPESKDQPAARAAALIAAGGLAYWQNDFGAARSYYEEALETFRSVDDRGGVAEALYNLGFLSLIDGEPRRARELHEQALATYEELGDELSLAFVKWGIAMSHIQERNLEVAHRLGLEALETFERHRNWYGRSLGEFIVLQVDRLAGNHQAARLQILESMDRPDSRKDISTLSSLLEIQGDIEIAMGYPRRGLRLAAVAANLRNEYGGGAPAPLLVLSDPRRLVSDVLAESEIEVIWEEGRHLAIDEIIAYARKDPGTDE